MFSVRLVTADSYQATPLPQLDPTYSEFRGSEIKNVPIVRVFGTTPTGEKTCLHLHGVFPYVYVPFTGEDNVDAYAYKLAASLDTAINISLGSATSNTQHVYQIQRVAGIPYYGYHRREHQFLKISFYNPAMIKKATDLLQNGSVLNQRLQPHEAHIPYILQFMMDYNLHGMNLINLSSVKHRRVAPVLTEMKSSSDSVISMIESVDYLPASVVRQSICELEVDALVSDILNREELKKGIELNPGLAAIWEEERARRLQFGLPSDDSHLVNPPSPKRPEYGATVSDIYQQQRLSRRIQMISQCDESSLSSGITPTPYPLEVTDGNQLINASNLESSNVNNLDRSQQQLGDVTSLTPLSGSQGLKNSQSTYDGSILDSEDVPLVEMLMELARDSNNQETVDDDSVLGTQSSLFDNGGNKSDNDDEDDLADLNLTCLELDSMSSWDNVEKSPSQLVPVNKLEVNTKVPQESIRDIFMQDTDIETHDSEESRLPQLDGAGDLSSFIESEEEESIKRCEELKRVSECQLPKLNNNYSDSDNQAFITGQLVSDLSKSNKNGDYPITFISDESWPSYLPNENALEQFNTMDYEPLGTEFESDFDNVMGLSLLLTDNDETSVGINLTVEDERIPLTAVLNGDPCFTQTAEMDKSDFTELQDQYVSLLDSALVPDVYKNSYDNDIVNSQYDRLGEKEMVSLNSRSFRITTNSRNINLSSENVTPNIQEPDAKVCKNKFSLPSAFERIDENCKDFSRLTSDSSDYNCNVVATWEELQDPKFIPKRILKRKCFGKARKRVLRRRPILSDSTLARRGRLRKSLTNTRSHIVQQDNVIHILDNSSNTSIDAVPLEINEKPEGTLSCERLIAQDNTNTTVVDSRKVPHESSTKQPLSHDLSHDVASDKISQEPTQILSENLNNSHQNILDEILPNNSGTCIQITLPNIRFPAYLIGNNDSTVTPILADCQELVSLPPENEILHDNNPHYPSYYSSTRSHSGIIPFGRLNHHHCYYSFMRMKLIHDYVFTSDQIWVIEKRKRGKLRKKPTEICNKNCRLPFVPLQKIEIAKTAKLNMLEFSIKKMGPEYCNLSCDSSKVDFVDDNNESITNIDKESSLKNSKYNNEIIGQSENNYEIDNINGDEKELTMKDLTYTQSAQITSTQNHDQFIVSTDNGSTVIKENKSYNEEVGREKRSILFKLDDKNNTSIVNSYNGTQKIVELSIRKNNDDDNIPINIKGDSIQLELIKKKRAERKIIKNFDAEVTTLMQFREIEEFHEENNGNVELTSIKLSAKTQSNSQYINTIELADMNSITNKESNVISSSQSESASLSMRPEIWCSIDRDRIDFEFIAATTSERNEVKNTEDISDCAININKTSTENSEAVGSRVFRSNVDGNIIPRSDIGTNSTYQQRYDGFDDTTLDVHLCDSLYKDDIASNSILGNTETNKEHQKSNNYGDINDSQEFTNAVTEADFSTGKNYTIDAITMEIPQCLFEEDSNCENTQRKLIDLSSDNGSLHIHSPESFSTVATNMSIIDNRDNVNINIFNSEQEEESNNNTMLIIDNSTVADVTRHEILSLSDGRKSMTVLRSPEIDEDESSNDSNCTSVLARFPESEQLYCLSKDDDNSDEEMITRMINSILVLQEHEKPDVTSNITDLLEYEKKILKRLDDNEIKVVNDDNSRENSDNSLKNVSESPVHTVFKYPSEEVPIVHQINISKDIGTDKEFVDVNTTTLNRVLLSLAEKTSKLSNNRINGLEITKLSEAKKSNVELSGEVVPEVNMNIEDLEITPITEDFIHLNESSVIRSDENNITGLDTEVYLDEKSGIISVKNCCKLQPLNGYIHESNNNQIICQYNSSKVEDDIIKMQKFIGKNFEEIKVLENRDVNLKCQDDNKMLEVVYCSSENELIGVAHDSGHNISQATELSKSNQYLNANSIMKSVESATNSTVDMNGGLGTNKIVKFLINENVKTIDDVDSGVESTEPKFYSEIIVKNSEENVEQNEQDDEKKWISNISSKSIIKTVNEENSYSIPKAPCRKLSVVLQRLELNDLNKYLKSNKKIEVYNETTENRMKLNEEKNKRKHTERGEKVVHFNEKVFVFESEEYTHLVDEEDRAEQMVYEENQIKSSTENDNLVGKLEQIENKTEQSISLKFVKNGECSIVRENSIINTDKMIDNGDMKEEDNKMVKKIVKNENEEKVGAKIECAEAIKRDCKKVNRVSIEKFIYKSDNSQIDIMLSEKNAVVNIENENLSRCKPKITNNIIYEVKQYNSGTAVNQKENVLMKKIDEESEETKEKSANLLRSHNKPVNEHDVNNCENKIQSTIPDIIQIKNNTVVDYPNGLRDVARHDKSPTVIERKNKAMSCLNETSAILINELNNHQVKSAHKQKPSNISTAKTKSATNNSLKNIPLTVDEKNPFQCFHNNDRILRSYRTSSGYRNKIHTVSIDQKMIFTKVTISDQQLCKKSAKEKFLGHIGLSSMKPRGLGWLPEQSMTGFIQLQQPHVVLHRLTPSILKHYGYTRRFKSNKLGKRFKSSVDRFMIPAYDGAADLSSSDSEPDVDVTVMNTEKRVCVYRSCKKISERNVVTPSKRKKSSSDEDQETHQSKHLKCCTLKKNIPLSKASYRSPYRNLLRSPSAAGNYSPLRITVTSPKTHRTTRNDLGELQNENANAAANVMTSCTTPRRRSRLMHDNILRKKMKPSIDEDKESVDDPKMNNEHHLMGELNTLDNFDTVPIAKSSSAFSYHKRRNSSSDINDVKVRKNLFFTIEDEKSIRPSVSEQNAEIDSGNENIKNKKISFECESIGPSTSGLHKFHTNFVNNHLEYDVDNSETSEQSNAEMCLRYSPSQESTSSPDNEDDDLCNVTFTQYLSSHELLQQQSLSGDDQSTLARVKNPITIVPKFNPPTFKRIVDTMSTYNIPKFRNSEPFFSNQADAPGQKELAHKILNVPGKGVTDLSVFKSSMENITGINRWRRMKINEFYPTPGTFKSTNIRQRLASHASVAITPFLSAPTPENVIKWLRARDYLKKKELKKVTEAIVETEKNKDEKKFDDSENTLQGECTSDSSIVEGSPERVVTSNSSKFLDRMLRSNKINELRVSTDLTLQQTSDSSYKISGDSTSEEIAPSLKSILEKSALFKKVEQPKQIGVSFGQIECVTKSVKTNVDNENMKKCKALTRYQFITIFCVEVHVNTRDNLLPDPQHDSISALFYAIQSDVPSTSPINPLEHGLIVVSSSPNESKLAYYYGSNLPFAITIVDDEKKLFETFIDIVKRSDAEILIGWEIESLSWGYIFKRALQLGIKFCEGISRVPTSPYKRDNQVSTNLDSLADTKLPGRIVLDIWRIMKSEVALLTYTFENVMYHVMNERLPCPSFNSLTKWWQTTQSRWKVVQHYSTKILGILRILEQLDIIGRTSEFARLFGIQFYEVFSRGSQFRVESLMLRLAKPLNFIAVSPSPQQRASMRAMEALPLIMEPESMFYSDPVVVLDFQSLYPSIIIAHNYCFSTCLGRIEHIGQPDPFEFGAYVLRVPKHTALRMQGKINYSPCGVAFVKSEVRRGILPRMLTEILETRIMVKKAMKDHAQDDKLLQRVLHSRQKGLKDLANVTYGYTAANFTGRMPCVEVGDSVISKAKETLERAIKLVESTPKWGARVIYGDTDSLFILIPGRSKDDAFKIGQEMADAVTASNPSPIKLKFEKILYPTILQTKKRYCGYMYETPEQKEPTYLAKGIETVRRDGCPAVSKILEKTLKILFSTKDVSLVKQYVTKQLDKVLRGKVSLEDLTFSKEFRGLRGYKERACVPALELTRRLMKKDPRAIPRRSERVRYVIVAGAPNQALIHCVRSPWELIDDPGLRPNGIYYVTRVIIPPLNRCLNLMGVDVNLWFKAMPRRQIYDNPSIIPDNKQKQTISQYFGTIVCVPCGKASNKGICSDCLAHPTDTLVILHEKLRRLERFNDHVTRICQSCVGRGDIADCVSLDCPVLYRRVQMQRDLTNKTELQKIIEEVSKLAF